MKKESFIILLSLLIVCSLTAFNTCKYNNSYNANLRKKNIRIVITDSGIGGLSVMADIADKLNSSGSYKRAELIFVNALFDPDSGYNSLQERDEKISIFNKVLYAIDKEYKPDLIFVACNTLSVLIEETQFSKQIHTPVVGIVEPGVDLICKSLAADENSAVIIFGTETTIGENAHKNALISKNIDEKRIITKACPQLQSYIEQDPLGEETEMLISFYLTEALEGVANYNIPVHLSLNCSHYGYSEELWLRAISGSGYKVGKILNPNMIMGDLLFTEDNRGRFTETRVKFNVVSKVELANVESMLKIFKDESEGLTEALKNYNVISDLF